MCSVTLLTTSLTVNFVQTAALSLPPPLSLSLSLLVLFWPRYQTCTLALRKGHTRSVYIYVKSVSDTVLMLAWLKTAVPSLVLSNSVSFFASLHRLTIVVVAIQLG